MYWIKLGMADWLEVTRDEYIDFENQYYFLPPVPHENWSGFSISGRITDEKLSEYTLDNQAEFQPFVKLKDGVQR